MAKGAKITMSNFIIRLIRLIRLINIIGLIKNKNGCPQGQPFFYFGGRGRHFKVITK